MIHDDLLKDTAEIHIYIFRYAKHVIHALFLSTSQPQSQDLILYEIFLKKLS